MQEFTKKNFFLLEPEPEKKIENGSGSKGPKKPGSGSETLVFWFFVNYSLEYYFFLDF